MTEESIESIIAPQDDASVVTRLLRTLGVGSAPQGTRVRTHRAAQPTQYPTNEDAEFARLQDYSYGQPWAPEFNNEAYRLLVGNPNASPLPATQISAERLAKEHDPKLVEQLNNYYARAALAVQNSGLALLGFDPSKTAADVMRDPKNVNMVGFYRPKTDEMYANARDPSAIVHESIHRGIQKLKDTPFWQPEFDEILNPENENAVRWIMKTKMGNPEGGGGEVDARQRDSAAWRFTQSARAKDLSKLLEKMDYAASAYMAAKRPGGPR